MPNIGNAIKDEIVRLSRKESRSQLDSTKKASIRHRREIAVLKRQVPQLTRQVSLVSRRTLSQSVALSVDPAGKPARFSAKGLRVRRERLGFSAENFEKLFGVSAQSVYNWEHEKARPRAEQISKIGALRGIGKREAKARLDQLVAAEKMVKPKS